MTQGDPVKNNGPCLISRMGCCAVSGQHGFGSGGVRRTSAWCTRGWETVKTRHHIRSGSAQVEVRVHRELRRGGNGVASLALQVQIAGELVVGFEGRGLGAG